jgi:small basic protein
MVTIIDISITAVGAFLAMCMFSTLYGKGNPLYSFAEESYIGFATALTIIWNVNYIYQTGILNTLSGNWSIALSILLGLMILFRIHPKYSYVARLPIAVALGGQFGLSLRTIIFSGFIQQIQATIKPLFAGTTQTLIYNWTLVISVVFMLTFFFYTVEIEGPLKASATFGEYLLYISFGAIFAQTFMGRLGLFVGFIQSFTVPNWKQPYLVVSMILVLAIILALDRFGLLEKFTPEE